VPQDRQLVREVQTILAEQLFVKAASPELDLLDAGLVDSVGLVELIVTLEERLGVSLPMEDLQIDDLRSVCRIADLIERLGPPSSNGKMGEAVDDQSTVAG
jgi:acyl carrier protein